MVWLVASNNGEMKGQEAGRGGGGGSEPAGLMERLRAARLHAYTRLATRRNTE